MTDPELTPELAERTLFVSGGGISGQTRAFLEQMSDRVVAKPVDPATLFDRMEALFEAQDARRRTG